MRFASVVLLAALSTAPSFSGEVPRPAPEFSLTVPGKGVLELKSLRGKTVVLAFISTSCPHCQKLTADLGQIQKDYAAKGVQVVESAFQEGVTEKAVAEFTALYNPPFPVGMDDRQSVNNFLQVSVMTMLYVPHVVIIDRRGVIRSDNPALSPYMKDAPANVRADLDKLLAEYAASAAAKKSVAPKQ